MVSKTRKLSATHKIFVVQRLAMFDSPKEAADALRDEHGIEIAPQSVEHYDPTKRAGERLSAALREIFESTRKTFLEQPNEIPIANLTVRLRRLEAMSRAAQARGNYPLAAALMEQAAKDRGNVYTNRREHTGKDGGPIKYSEVEQMAEPEIEAELRAYGIEPDSAPKPATH